MTSPWGGTTPQIASQNDSRYETPGGAQQKADKAEQDAKDYTDAKLALPELPIANEAIVERHIRDESISSRTIAQKAVTRSKIGTGAVGWQELDTSLVADIDDVIINANFERVNERLKDISINIKDFGAAGDWNGTMGTDDSIAFQNAIDSLPNGGEIFCPGRFLIGGLVVNVENLVFVGRDKNDKLIVKNGSTGVTVKQNKVSFRNLEIISQGTKTDGLGTTGILYEKTPVSSIGFASVINVDFKGFSGSGLKVINAIQFTYDMGYVVSCTKGILFDRDSGGLSFGSTVTLKRIYVTSCTRGIETNRLYRTSFENVIGEYCDYGIYANISAFTLYRSYFERNNIKGCYAVDCEIQDLFQYENNTTTDAVQIDFTSATLPNERGYIRQNKFSTIAKTVGLLSNYGVNPKFLSAYGNSNNVGLLYGDAVVPIIRGDNIADPIAWASNRISEFQGWDYTRQGYKIQGITAGDNSYGMKQTVSLDNTKQYVIDVAVTNVLGSGLTTIRCGALVVTNGVSFTPPTNGSNEIKIFGIDIAGTSFECYVNAFVISEVLAKTDYTSIAEDKLTRKQQGRGIIFATAAPTTGTWAVNERVDNSAPTILKNISHWTRITQGSGTTGVWTAHGIGFGTTANRPTLTSNDQGYGYFDTTLIKMIMWNGSSWLV